MLYGPPSLRNLLIHLKGGMPDIITLPILSATEGIKKCLFQMFVTFSDISIHLSCSSIQTLTGDREKGGFQHQSTV